jgi:hypothetical protein
VEIDVDGTGQGYVAGELEGGFDALVTNTNGIPGNGAGFSSCADGIQLLLAGVVTYDRNLAFDFLFFDGI